MKFQFTQWKTPIGKFPELPDFALTQDVIDAHRKQLEGVPHKHTFPVQGLCCMAFMRQDVKTMFVLGNFDRTNLNGTRMFRDACNTAGYQVVYPFFN